MIEATRAIPKLVGVKISLIAQAKPLFMPAPDRVAHVVKETSNVRIEHPVHSFPLDAHRQRVQRLMWAATGPEPIRKAFEVDLINLIENRNHSLLNNLVLQRRDA
jgi:hypothetical protein